MLDWLNDLRTAQPVGHALAVLCLVAAFGLFAGRFRIRGIGLGVAGVLFVGILFGHFGIGIDADVRSFLQEFGLILFVYTIGMQLGPGFIASLRKEGLALNLLAAGIVLAGGALAAAIGLFTRVDVGAAAGIFAGATTNTPALGAAQQAMEALPGTTPDRAALPALAYAVAYPIGIAGIITSLLVLKRMFGVDVAAEGRAIAAEWDRTAEPLGHASVVVRNPNLDGLALGALPALEEIGVVVSRIQPAGSGTTALARPDTVVWSGDVLLAVGTRRALDQFVRIVGDRSTIDIRALPSQALHRRVVVTRAAVLGRGLGGLGLDAVHGVSVTRVSRAGLEMTPQQGLRLNFGDRLDLVGDEAGLAKAAELLGDSVKSLDETQFIPMFLGIALGVFGGLLPIAVPGLPAPLRIGLAGGPLIAALVLSRVGHAGKLVWHMPPNVNSAFRELGITIFLACVGLKAGEKFFASVFSAQGLSWALAAALVTVVPLIAAGVIARRKLRMNYLAIMGLVAGSTTDPPALAFATGMAGNDAPILAYATVYPLTMILRILTAQVLVVALG